MLNKEQVKNLKEQILKQIDSWKASEKQKSQAKEQIQAMNAEQLEQFLIKNKLIKPQEQTTPQQKQEQECPFCLIIEGKIPAHKIDENKSSIAVLEINPLSKGHTLIIPKQHKKIEKLPSQAFTLSKKIASKIKRKLKPESVSIQTAELFNHGAINIIPVYKDEKPEKYKASEEELKQLEEKLKTKPRKIRKKSPKKLEKAPVRIP